MGSPASRESSLDEFFAGHEDSRRIFDTLRAAIDGIGPADMRVTKSQVAFRRRTAFAWAWIPERYLRRPLAPLVLSLARGAPHPSPRFKQIVEPAPGRYMHHVELYAEAEIDAEVVGWLREAWEASA